MTDYIIIVAGGKGLRMGSDIPKQFLPIGGKPVLMRTIERFHHFSEALRIILVLPKAQQAYWHELCGQYQFDVPYMLADGGETRFHSVQHGLALIPDDAQGVVGVHDGVRPFPAIDVIRRCYDTARTAKAVIPVTPVVETLRHITEGTKPRGDYRLANSTNFRHPTTEGCQPPTFLRGVYRRCVGGRVLWTCHHNGRGQPRKYQDYHSL